MATVTENGYEHKDLACYLRCECSMEVVNNRTAIES